MQLRVIKLVFGYYFSWIGVQGTLYELQPVNVQASVLKKKKNFVKRGINNNEYKNNVIKWTCGQAHKLVLHLDSVKVLVIAAVYHSLSKVSALICVNWHLN